MDLQHKMLRSTIEILINKAIVEMQSDTRRSIRNFIDLGVYFAKGENQKKFFMRMQSTIQDAQNPFYKLVSDMLEKIDIDTVKTLGLNMGCSTFTHGVNTIRKLEPELGFHIPPLVFYTWEENEKNNRILTPEHERRLISEGEELGIFTHAFYVNRDLYRAREIFQTAKENPLCSFFMLAEAEIVDDEFIKLAYNANNVMISLCVPSDGMTDAHSEAFMRMRKARLMFGLHVFYNEETLDYAISDEFLDPFIDEGCFFCGYISKCKDGVPEKMTDYVHKMRTGAGKPMLIFDWKADMDYIIGVFSKGGDLIKLTPDGGAYRRNDSPENKIEIKNMSLVEILKATMPPLV